MTTTAGYSSDQVRRAEAPLLAAGEPLMARAAAALADEIRAVLAQRGPRVPVADPGASDLADAVAGSPTRPVVLVLSGSGDNGGDALYAAAHLAADGLDVRVVTTGSRVHEEALAEAERAGAAASTRGAEPGSPEFDALLDGVDVIVDGVVGIGANGDGAALRGRARDVIRAVRPRVLMRIAGAPSAVAVDLPSGIGPDDGAVPDPAGVLPALVTVTFGAVKAGLLREPAAGLAGRVVLVDLGLDLSGEVPTA